MFQSILFDLDGTLTDAAPGITNSVKYALSKFGIDETDDKKLRKFLGPPLISSFMEFYGFSKEKAQKAVEYYSGIPKLLQKLKADGKTLIIATSKPETFAVQIAEHFEIDAYFDLIAGSNLDNTRSKKAQVIEYALETLGILDRAHAVMIGDREHDIKGAKKTGLRSIGVLYGYASPGELENAGADFTANSPEELYTIISSN